MQIHPTVRSMFCFSVLLSFALSGYGQIQRLHPDVENIGKRTLNPNVTYSMTPEREYSFGYQTARQFERSVTLVEDRIVTEYVSDIGSRIVDSSDADTRFDFKLISSEKPELLVFPGGRIFLTKGFLKSASAEAEFAAALAKAIAHVAARHTLRVLDQMQALNYRAIPVDAAVAWDFLNSGNEVPPFEGRADFIRLKAELEPEADQLAIQYLWNTGYDPQSYLGFFEGLHTADSPRLNAAGLEIQSLPSKQRLVTNTPEFDAIKLYLQNRK